MRRFLLIILLLTFSLSTSVIAGSHEKKQVDIFEKVYKEVDNMKKNNASIEEIMAYKREQGIITLSLTQSFYSEEENAIVTEKYQYNKDGKQINKSITIDDSYFQNSPTSDSSVMSIYHLEPSDIETRCWVDHFPRDNEYAIYGELTKTSGSEDYPASYDVLGISWDIDVFNYLRQGSSSYNNGEIWLRESKHRYTGGTILFSLEDDAMKSHSYGSVSAWAILEPKVSNANTSGGVDFTHTYEDIRETRTQTGEASISWGSEGDSLPRTPIFESE